MRIDRELCLALSGGGGFDLTDNFDCNVFLVAAGDAWLMFDAGSGRSPERALEVLAGDGIDPRRIRHLFLTHGHADHSGGAAHWREALGLEVHATPATAAMVSAGDEAAISVDVARRAGVYPADYAYRSCAIDDVLAIDRPLAINGVTVRAIASPGHSHDHVSYLVETPDRRMLIAGDALFHGGKVAIQNIYDCDIAAICETVRRLAGIDYDALLPGHLNFSLRNGRRHADAALAHVAALRCPPSII
jgi:glyoxylase-like metal-dependent hydrolase (beta-lactamase superfamily II)